jgi:hypothetical protein
MDRNLKLGFLAFVYVLFRYFKIYKKNRRINVMILVNKTNARKKTQHLVILGLLVI